MPEYNEKLAAAEFVNTLKALANFWAETAETKKAATEGLAFSVLSLIDGCNMSSPGFNLMPNIVDDVEEDGEVAEYTHEPYMPDRYINANTMMHELFYSKS